jgi:hypothetical protein
MASTPNLKVPPSPKSTLTPSLPRHKALINSQMLGSEAKHSHAHSLASHLLGAPLYCATHHLAYASLRMWGLLRTREITLPGGLLRVRLVS